MSREWKHGDVGVTAGPDDERFLVGRCGEATAFAYMDGEYTTIPPRDDARPLVVIDPESKTDVRALWTAMGGHPELVGWHKLREALRSLVTPPKPPEPTGLGAVVEDDRGVRFVRTESAKGVRNPWSSALHPLVADEIECLPYTDIAAVKVHSEGVTP